MCLPCDRERLNRYEHRGKGLRESKEAMVTHEWKPERRFNIRIGLARGVMGKKDLMGNSSS